MAYDDITSDQAAAILKNGKPFGVGGKTVQVVGLSAAVDTPLYRETAPAKGGDTIRWVAKEESVIDDLEPISELTGGLDLHALHECRNRALSSVAEERCFNGDGSSSAIRVVTANFNKSRLEDIRDRAAGVAKTS